jgi:hypothetical protein
MNIRLVIDKMVVEGMSLSRGERIAFEESLRGALTQALNERAALQSLPEGRRARREQMHVCLSGNSGVVGLGNSLGASLGGHVWGGEAPQANGRGREQ